MEFGLFWLRMASHPLAAQTPLSKDSLWMNPNGIPTQSYKGCERRATPGIRREERQLQRRPLQKSPARL
jgi:hypothetical protein